MRVMSRKFLFFIIHESQFFVSHFVMRDVHVAKMSKKKCISFFCCSYGCACMPPTGSGNVGSGGSCEADRTGFGSGGGGGAGRPQPRARRTQRRVTHSEKRYHSGSVFRTQFSGSIAKLYESIC